MLYRHVMVALLWVASAITVLGDDTPIKQLASADQRWSAGGEAGSPEFRRHVVPLFSKLGCNMRACHGSFQGQNGFRLSLFGSEPELDRRELLETDPESEGDGPRAGLATPADSLMLSKPTSEDEHGGGQRMAVGSWQYNVLRQWIADGAKFDPQKESKLVRFKLQPSELVFADRSQPNRVRAMAWFDDDTIRLEAAEALRAIDPAAARDAGVDATSARDLPALAISVADTQKDVAARIEHAMRLGDLGADAAPFLIAVFDDPSIEVSRAAASAFRKIGSDALPKLQVALRHDSPRVRSTAASALAALGPDAKPAIHNLANLLSDSDRSVRNAAATACDQLGSVADAAVPALIVTMNDNREQEATRQLAIKALAQTGPASRDSVIKALRDVNHQGNFGVRSLAEEMLKQIERQ